MLIWIAVVAMAQPPAGTQPPVGTPPPVTQPPPGTQPPPPDPIPSQSLTPTVPTETKKATYPSQVGGKTLPEWLKELGESKDGAARELAVKTLPAFGPAAREPALRPLLKACREDSDPGVRVNAILTLGAMGANNKEEAKMIIDALIIAINQGSVGGMVRLHATRAIANYGSFPEQADNAIPTLVNIAKDPSWETRKSIAYALGRIGGPTRKSPEAKPLPPGALPPPVDPKTGPNPAALKALLAMLGDASATVRLEVVESMVSLGPPAVSIEQYSATVTPYMTAILDRTKNEKDKSVLVWLHMLSMRLDGNLFNDTTIGKIVELGRGNDPDATVQALSSLSLLSEKAVPQALPFAREMLRHSEPVVVAAAAGYIGSAAGITGLPATVTASVKATLPELERAKSETKDEMLKQVITSTVDAINGKKPPNPNVTKK
jgi:HEAT repeat protein